VGTIGDFSFFEAISKGMGGVFLGDAMPRLVWMLEAKAVAERDAAARALATLVAASGSYRKLFRKEEMGIVNVVRLLDAWTRLCGAATSDSPCRCCWACRSPSGAGSRWWPPARAGSCRRSWPPRWTAPRSSPSASAGARCSACSPGHDMPAINPSSDHRSCLVCTPVHRFSSCLFSV
jgi:hypothetical protein